MDELYNMCKKCGTIRIDYSQMLQQDKYELCEQVQYIVEQYRNELVCTNTWYAMTLDITGLIKRLGYEYTIEIELGELCITPCATNIVQLG